VYLYMRIKRYIIFFGDIVINYIFQKRKYKKKSLITNRILEDIENIK